MWRTFSTLQIIWSKGKHRKNWGNMKLRVRIRTFFRLILFFTAYKIIASYNEREWGWLRNSTNNLEKNDVEDYYHEIRVYSVYLKDKGVISENVAGFVTFEDLVVGSDIEMYHTQHMRNLIKRIGEKYKMIVLNPGGSEISTSQTTLSKLLLRTLDYENQIRSKKGLSKIEAYFYVSSKIA